MLDVDDGGPADAIDPSTVRLGDLVSAGDRFAFDTCSIEGSITVDRCVRFGWIDADGSVNARFSNPLRAP